MSDFARIWQDAMPALDGVFAEPLMIVPRSGEYVKVAGVPFIRMGVLDQRPLAMRQAGGGADKADQVDRAGSRCTIDFDARVFLTPEEIPAEGWRISTVPSPTRPTALTFEVAWLDPSGQGRVSLHVAPL